LPEVEPWGWSRSSFGRTLGGRNPQDRRRETVAFTGDSFHIARVLGFVAKNLANLPNSGVDAVLGIDEDFTRPEVLGNFGSGYELAIACKQQDQQLHRLAFEPDRMVVPEEFEPAAIKPEVAELIRGNRQESPSTREV
jgi:hypothetical protein